MQDIDKLIDEALGQEESDLLRRVGGKPDLVEFALGGFGRGVGWLVWLMMFVQIVMTAAGAWAAWEFFQATDPVSQLRWGLPAAVVLLMALIIKSAVPPAVHHDRVMRELKRLELQLARTQG
jgi:hypothetical protein